MHSNSIDIKRLARTLLVLAAFGLQPNATAQGQNEAATAKQPLRLEDTIRGNKEQPKVLSIVPWQLPKHRQIDNTLDWQPQLMQPVMLQRNQFLRRLAWQQRLSAPKKLSQTASEQ